MRTLENHLLLFDAECAICRRYTGAMVNSGLIEQEGRAAYQEMEVSTCPAVDPQRAANEIALVNLETGEVTYGIKGFFKIFEQARPGLAPLFRFAPFAWLAGKLYALIAYNRRVIAPPAGNREPFTVQPDFRPGYRLAYMLAGCLMGSFIFTRYIAMLKVLPEGNRGYELLFCAAQFLFQGMVIVWINPVKRWDYLGNLATIYLLGGLYLLPGLLCGLFFPALHYVYAGYFLYLLGLLAVIHFQRARRFGGGLVLTLSGLLYLAAGYLLFR